MVDGSLATVLARMEAALSRLEAAAPQVAAHETDLAERHARLRIAVTHSLKELDGLIGGNQP